MHVDTQWVAILLCDFLLPGQVVVQLRFAITGLICYCWPWVAMLHAKFLAELPDLVHCDISYNYIRI